MRGDWWSEKIKRPSFWKWVTAFNSRAWRLLFPALHGPGAAGGLRGVSKALLAMDARRYW